MSKNRITRQKTKNVVNNHIYSILFRDELGCTWCRPNKGCNRKYNWYSDHTNWKILRKNQWK